MDTAPKTNKRGIEVQKCDDGMAYCNLHTEHYLVIWIIGETRYDLIPRSDFRDVTRKELTEIAIEIGTTIPDTVETFERLSLRLAQLEASDSIDLDKHTALVDAINAMRIDVAA